jgi:hypothetical protein
MDEKPIGSIPFTDSILNRSLEDEDQRHRLPATEE